MRRKSGHWTERLFIEKPHLYSPFLTARRAAGARAAAEISTLLTEHGVKAGGRVLDLCCGIGRIAIPLAKRGFHVTGVDLSPDFIENAIKDAAARRVSRRTRFIVGDYRDISSHLSDESVFDAVLSTFTSIGYYGSHVDLRAFEQLASHTAKGGTIIIEAGNRDWILSHFEKRGWEMAGDVLVLEEREFDDESSHMVSKWTYYRIVGPHIRHEGDYVVDHRLYGPKDLSELVESAGWKVESVTANFAGDPIDTSSLGHSRMVLVGRRR